MRPNSFEDLYEERPKHQFESLSNFNKIQFKIRKLLPQRYLLFVILSELHIKAYILKDFCQQNIYKNINR